MIDAYYRRLLLALPLNLALRVKSYCLNAANTELVVAGFSDVLETRLPTYSLLEERLSGRRIPRAMVSAGSSDLGGSTTHISCIANVGSKEVGHLSVGRLVGTRRTPPARRNTVAVLRGTDLCVIRRSLTPATEERKTNRPHLLAHHLDLSLGCETRVGKHEVGEWEVESCELQSCRQGDGTRVRCGVS